MYLAWDVGVKNLAYCLADNKGNIEKWNIINLSNKKEYMCSGEFKNGKQCSSKGICYDKETMKFYCKRHSPPKGTKQLYECLTCPKKATKICLQSDKFYCGKCAPKDNDAEYDDLIINKNVAKTSLNKLGLSLIRRLDEHPEFLKANTIDIENQPCLKNPTMKSVQMILYSYFLIKNQQLGRKISLNLVSARNKLKFTIENDAIKETKKIKDNYKRNKKLAIDFTRYFLEGEDWLSFFETHSKKDDLADCFLMIRYRIKTT